MTALRCVSAGGLCARVGCALLVCRWGGWGLVSVRGCCPSLLTNGVIGVPLLIVVEGGGVEPSMTVPCVWWGVDS